MPKDTGTSDEFIALNKIPGTQQTPAQRRRVRILSNRWENTYEGQVALGMIAPILIESNPELDED